MSTSDRTKIVGAVVGLIVCAVGVGWILVRGPQPFGTILTILGASFSAALLASLWIYRPSKGRAETSAERNRPRN